MSSKLDLAILLAVTFGCSVVHAAPLSSGEIEETINQLLIERHPKDDPAWWKKLGPTAPPVIISMFEKASDVYPKQRLLGGLAWFSEDAQALAFLKQQADTTSEDVLRNTAVRGVGASQGAKEVEFVSKFLQHADPQTRLAAAKTLQNMGDPKARALLDRYLADEKAAWIVKEVRKEKSVGLIPLKSVSNSEDRPNPAFAGTWRGYWIMPLPGPKGMKSQGALLKLRMDAVTQALVGELLLAEKGKSARTIVLDQLKAPGSSGRLSGKLRAAILSQSEGFEGVLKETKNLTLLEIDIAGSGAKMVLRKEP